MRLRAPPAIALLLVALSPSAFAATFAPVHVVGADVYVELPHDGGSLAEAAGPPRRVDVPTRHAFVRSLRGAPGEDRTVRLVAADGVCEGHIGLEVLLGLYEPMDEDRPDPANARWMLAAKVRGCHGPFDVAVLEPTDSSPPVALGPADEAAAAAVAAAQRALGASRVLEEARSDWRGMFGDAERARQAAWRADGRTFALAEVRLEGGECGSTRTVRTVVAQDSQGRVSVVLVPSRVDLEENVVSIADLDGDGTIELVARGLDDAVKVMRLRGAAEIILDAGEIPFLGCPC